jgi:hypothetical protein
MRIREDALDTLVVADYLFEEDKLFAKIIRRTLSREAASQSRWLAAGAGDSGSEFLLLVHVRLRLGVFDEQA